MALVHEETGHEYLPVSLMVSQREKGETIEPWKLIHCEVDGMDRLTPHELVEIGEWLIQQGKRIGREYKSNGAPRNVAQPDLLLRRDEQKEGACCGADLTNTEPT